MCSVEALNEESLLSKMSPSPMLGILIAARSPLGGVPGCSTAAARIMAIRTGFRFSIMLKCRDWGAEGSKVCGSQQKKDSTAFVLTIHPHAEGRFYGEVMA